MHVAELWRYPVKSIRGEMLQSAEVLQNGIRGDREIVVLATARNRIITSRTHHRLLGFPDTLQDDMRSQCQLVSHGVTDEDDPRQEELLKGTLDWRLLLQVDSDPQAGMRWANNGMLYYWMNQAHFQTPHVDASWLVLQSE